MTNSSLKEQLQAVAAQIVPDKKREQTSEKSTRSAVKPNRKKNEIEQKAPARQSSSRNTNHQSKPKWLEYAQYGVELLRAYYPNTFPEDNIPKPLKVGIKQDLVKALSINTTMTIDDKACMVKSLAYYVNTLSYLKSIQVGMDRIDLEGNTAGKVTKEEAAYSKERYQSRMDAKKTGSHSLKKNTMESETSTFE